MEPIGLGLGIVSLAALFSSCLECFDYVQLGRSFGEDYGKCLLRLDVARLRFSRWGASVGLGPQVTQHEDLVVQEREHLLAQRLLEEIKHCFETAEKFSGQYKERALVRDADVSALAVADTETDLGPEYRYLHTTMRELASKRQGHTSFARKTKWALYEKRKFDAMIDDVSCFVKELVELFPSQEQQQKELCRYEVQSVNRDERELLSTISDEDELMQNTIREIDPRGHSVMDSIVGGNSRFRLGDDNGWGVESKAHSAGNFIVSGSANVWVGNRNEGRRRHHG